MSQPKKRKEKRSPWALTSSCIIILLFIWTYYWRFISHCLAGQLSVVDLTLGTGRLTASSQLIRPSGCRPHQPTSNGSRWSKARAWVLWQGFCNGGEVPACTRRLTDDNALPRGYTDTFQCEAYRLRYCLKIRWWRICGWCFNTPRGLSSTDSISSPYSVSFYVTEQLGLD